MELTEASSWLIGNCHMKGLVKSGPVDGVWSLTEVGYAKRKWLLRLSPRQARADSEPTRSHLKPWGNRRISWSAVNPPVALGSYVGGTSVRDA